MEYNWDQEEGTSEWLRQMHEQASKKQHREFRIYPQLSCECNKPMMVTTKDGNKHQSCMNCGWKWDAPEEDNEDNEDGKKEDKEDEFKIYPLLSCGCNEPMIVTTNDGFKHQSCMNCGWKWNAPENK